jgi:hypothetical protein
MKRKGKFLCFCQEQVWPSVLYLPFNNDPMFIWKSLFGSFMFYISLISTIDWPNSFRL